METESRNRLSEGIDTFETEDVLRVLHGCQVAAANSVGDAVGSIAAAVDLLVNTVEADGRLVYIGAGSSATMALSDALELPGTFGFDTRKIVILIAGGTETLTAMTGNPDDNISQAQQHVSDARITPDDCIVSLSASGNTVYTVAATAAAKAAGASVIGIANNKNAQLFQHADVAIHLATAPEAVAGSTRMGAATAQKITLNMLSTAMAVRLGHVHDGYMVNLVADNRKLKDRARRIVVAIAGGDEKSADVSLRQAQGVLPIAVLLSSGCNNVADARDILARNNGKLRPSLEALRRR